MNVTHRGPPFYHQIILVYKNKITSIIPNSRFDIRQARLNIVAEKFITTKYRCLLDNFDHASTSKRNLPPIHTEQRERAPQTVWIKIPNCDARQSRRRMPLPSVPAPGRRAVVLNP